MNLSSYDGKVLVIIESTGKKEKVKNIFNQIGFSKVDVESTKGRLYDLPKDQFGIDSSNFDNFARVPLSERKIDQLSAPSYPICFIFTDNDIEGEMIAHDVSNVINAESFYRIRSQSVTLEGIKESLENISPISMEKIKGGMSRRIFDRYIGYNAYNHGFSDFKNQGQIGRILTPILNELENDNSPAGYINFSFNSDGDTWNVDIPIDKSEISIAEELLSVISDMPNPTIEETSSKILNDDSGLLDCGNGLYEISGALNVGVDDVSEALQELYEEGRLSYPRTDSFYLSDETAKSLSKLSEHFGVTGFDDEFLTKKANAMQELKVTAQDSHEAITPVGMDFPMFASMSSLALKDQVLVLIARTTLRSGQKDRRIHKKEGQLSLTGENNKYWRSVLSSFKNDPIIESSSSFIAGQKKHSPYNERISKMGINIGLKKSGPASLSIENNDRKVLRKMIECNIGRPSTLSYHATKISKKFLTKDGYVNSSGRNCINFAKDFAPGLLNSEKAVLIEKHLHEAHGSIDDKVNKALIESGIIDGGGRGDANLEGGVDTPFSDTGSEIEFDGGI